MTDLPTKGGSYTRAEDGTLTAVEQPKATEPVAQRAAEAVADQPAPRRVATKGGQ